MSESLIAGRYEILFRIGKGGMGTVYQARDRRLAREVAVKVLESENSDQDSLYYFQREARAAAALQHAGIVQVFDHSGANETPAFIVMELIKGQTAEALLIDRHPWPEAVAVAIVHEVAAALAYAHGQGVIHRDIKPANIMIDEQGRVVLTDFGLAKAFRDPSKLGATVSGRQTQLFGTPEFLSPEQVLSSASGPESDVFSLASTFYALLAGHSPFNEEDVVEGMRRIAAIEFEPLRSVRANVSAEVEALIHSCLVQDLMLRPEAAELSERCRGLLHDRGLPPPRALLAAFLADQLPSPKTAARAAAPVAAPAATTDLIDVGSNRAADRTEPMSQAAGQARNRPHQETVTVATAPVGLAEREAARGRRAQLLRGAAAAGVVLVGVVAGVWMMARPKADDLGAEARSSRAAGATPKPTPVVVSPSVVVDASRGPSSPPSPSAASGSVAALSPPAATAAIAEVAPPLSAPLSAPSPHVEVTPPAAPVPPPAAAPPPAEPGPRGKRLAKRPAEPPASAPASRPANNEPANVKILVNPWGTIFLDGKKVGNAPMVRQLSAPRGKHLVVVEHPSRGRIERLVRFGDDESVLFDFDAQGGSR